MAVAVDKFYFIGEQKKESNSSYTKFYNYYKYFFILHYRNVIFQRGNPIPYLIASAQISDKTPYIEVGKSTGVYITKRGNYPQLFDFVKETRDVDFVEQAGSGYIFTNGVDSLVVASEIYLKYFTVWTVPQNTLQTK